MIKEEIETIDIDIEGMSIFYNDRGAKFRFPVCNISAKNRAFFNGAAFPYLPEYFKWYVNDEWCILRPCDQKDRHAYKMGARDCCGVATLPALLDGGKLMCGYHKLYKTKNGIAFKRYELLEEGGR